MGKKATNKVITASKRKAYRLLTTITSCLNKGLVFGNKNEIVSEVADYGSVVIVESKDGAKFSVSKDEIVSHEFVI